jgi:BirA family biotin operon repressor/biotin-[acetyl-CoA-carboxylase] ligase
VDAQDHGHAAVPDGWQPLTLLDAAVAEAGRWRVWYVAETGSTNADLLAFAHAPDRTVLVAGHQTAGRGRLGRAWEAPPAVNLLVSILFRDVPEPAIDLTHRVAVAAVDAAATVAGVHARLKWPNDVLVDGRKLAGILAQRGHDGAVVVGMGLNVGWAPAGAALLGRDIEPIAVLTEVLRTLASTPHDVHDRYRELLDTLGRRVRVESASGDVVGRAVDIGRDGILLVVDDCAITHHVDAGDVVHLRNA